MKPALRNGGLVVDLERTHRCLSSAVMGGGLGWVRTWLNLQVESGYDCTDPEGDLLEAAQDLEVPVVGMLTAARVSRFTTINGARILKWDRHLGSVEPGKLADLMVVNGRGGDPYEHPPPAPPDVSSPQLTSSPPRKSKAISGIHRPALDVTGTVPGIDEAVFQEAAEQAKENCPVSKALQGNVELTVTPRLGS